MTGGCEGQPQSPAGPRETRGREPAADGGIFLNAGLDPGNQDQTGSRTYRGTSSDKSETEAHGENHGVILRGLWVSVVLSLKELRTDQLGSENRVSRSRILGFESARRILRFKSEPRSGRGSFLTETAIDLVPADTQLLVPKSDTLRTEIFS